MSKRGFAGMDPKKQAEIASKGGKAAHEQGRAHEFSREEAAAAGAIGGDKVSADRSYMARIGRKGGIKRGENVRKERERRHPELLDEVPRCPKTVDGIPCYLKLDHKGDCTPW
jgi:uncharacterized protein